MLWSPAQAETVYTWIDEDGSRVFSDQPRPGAQRLEIGPVETIPAPQVPRATTDTTTDIAVAYQQLRILSPEDGANIHSAPGNITIALQLEPALQDAHKLRLLLDGRPTPAQQSPEFRLQYLDRGTHQVQAQVIDAQKRTLITSDTHTFYMHRPSRLFNR